MTDFLAMGGYGAFVWPCYALVLGGMAGLAWLSFRKQRRLAQEAQRLRDDVEKGR